MPLFKDQLERNFCPPVLNGAFAKSVSLVEVIQEKKLGIPLADAPLRLLSPKIRHQKDQPEIS
jgi:hypothetical protein